MIVINYQHDYHDDKDDNEINRTVADKTNDKYKIKVMFIERDE